LDAPAYETVAQHRRDAERRTTILTRVKLHGHLTRINAERYIITRALKQRNKFGAYIQK